MKNKVARDVEIMWHVIGTSVLFFRPKSQKAPTKVVGYPPLNIFQHIAMEHRSANEAASTLESEITEQLSECAEEAEITAERKNAQAVERKKARKLADRCTGQEAVNAEQAQKKRLKLGAEQEAARVSLNAEQEAAIPQRPKAFFMDEVNRIMS